MSNYRASESDSTDNSVIVTVDETHTTGCVMTYGASNYVGEPVVSVAFASFDDLDKALLRRESRREQVGRDGAGYRMPFLARSKSRSRPEWRARSRAIHWRVRPWRVKHKRTET